MTQDEFSDDELGIKEIGEFLEMEMEEYDPLQDRYSEIKGKMEQLLRNLVLERLTNKRNELNILYLFQMLNDKRVNSEQFEKIFEDLDTFIEDIGSNSYRFDELIDKNNEFGSRVNPMMRELFL
jgi:hypothetical protein